MSNRDPQFYNELKQLNDDFIKFLKETHDKSPFFDMTPTVNDYVKQVADLHKQYPEKLVWGSGFAPKNTLFSFGSFQQISKPTIELNPPAPPQLQPPQQQQQQQQQTSAETEATQNSAEDEDAPPPEPKIDKYEEPDAKFSVRCKLYQKVDSNLEILGLGNIYVKSVESPGKWQVIFRLEPDLRKVLLNEVWSPSLPLKLLSKAVQLIFPDPSGKLKVYIAKVKDDKDAKALHDHLNSAKTI